MGAKFIIRFTMLRSTVCLHTWKSGFEEFYFTKKEHLPDYLLHVFPDMKSFIEQKTFSKQVITCKNDLVLPQTALYLTHSLYNTLFLTALLCMNVIS